MHVIFHIDDSYRSDIEPKPSPRCSKARQQRKSLLSSKIVQPQITTIDNTQHEYTLKEARRERGSGGFANAYEHNIIVCMHHNR